MYEDTYYWIHAVQELLWCIWTVHSSLLRILHNEKYAFTQRPCTHIQTFKGKWPFESVAPTNRVKESYHQATINFWFAPVAAWIRGICRAQIFHLLMSAFVERLLKLATSFSSPRLPCLLSRLAHLQQTHYMSIQLKSLEKAEKCWGGDGRARKNRSFLQGGHWKGLKRVLIRRYV